MMVIHHVIIALLVNMSCFHPAFVQRETNLHTGEILSTRFLGSKKSVVENPFLNKELSKRYDINACLDDFSLIYFGRGIELIKVPCGKCIGCRMDYSRSWADRMTYNLYLYDPDQCYFITLTYDDEHIDELPLADYGLRSLDYSHLDDFNKRFRNKFRDVHLQYYESGEYGDEYFRPHFHGIIYGARFTDLQFWTLNDNGDPIYLSTQLRDLWRNRGNVTIAPFSWRGAAYTASYVEKKRDGRLGQEYEAFHFEKEKCRMSRRPGIGYYSYLFYGDEIWRNNGKPVDRTVNSSGHLGIPRYFHKLAQEYGIYADDFKKWKKSVMDRGHLQNSFKLENSSFDINNVRKMLDFEERELLSTTHNRKF